MLNPSKKLKSVCKAKSEEATENLTVLFCDDWKVKGSMMKLAYLETSLEKHVISMFDVTLVFPRKSMERQMTLEFLKYIFWKLKVAPGGLL